VTLSSKCVHVENALEMGKNIWKYVLIVQKQPEMGQTDSGDRKYVRMRVATLKWLCFVKNTSRLSTEV
jgi:hypothetical protein